LDYWIIKFYFFLNLFKEFKTFIFSSLKFNLKSLEYSLLEYIKLKNDYKGKNQIKARGNT